MSKKKKITKILNMWVRGVKDRKVWWLREQPLNLS